MTNVIKINSVYKSYGQLEEPTQVLKGVDLDIQEGETLGILGSSGAGKSTLLNIIGTLEKPTGGTVTYKGDDVFSFSENELAQFRNKTMGFIFQFHHLLGDFTALENVMMPLLIGGYSHGTAKKEALEFLEKTGLTHRITHRPSQLSGGEQQRVALARALVTKPALILADEPTGNLDQENGEKIFDLLLDLNRELRTTLIVVTHNQALVSRLNRIVTLVDGKLLVQ